MNSPDIKAQHEATRQALRDLSAVQSQTWGDYIKSLDHVGVLLARANDALHVSLNRQPDPDSGIERYRIEDEDPPPVAEGFEPAIQQAVEQINAAFLCLLDGAGDALSACMQAVAEERRLLGIYADLNKR